MADLENRPSLVSNILAIAGFIILIVVVIWGLVHLASLSRSWFSGLFGGASAGIEVTAPERAQSGTPFTLSWKYDALDGQYALLYQCQMGLRFQVAGIGGAQNGVPCGAAYTLNAPESAVSLTPILSGTAELNVPLTVIFMPSATGTQVQGSASIVIAPAPGEAPLPAPEPAPAPEPTPAPAPIGPADLSVTILSASVDAAGNGIASFDIANNGRSASGSYYFTARLPVSGGQTYTSPQQASLAPGSHIVSTLRFTGAMGGVFSVSVDPTNIIAESSESNNYASQTLSAPYYYNSYNYPYNYAQTAGYQYQYYPQPNAYPYQYNYPYQYVPGYGYTNQYPYYQTSYPYAY